MTNLKLIESVSVMCEENGLEATVLLVDSLKRKHSHPMKDFIEKKEFFLNGGLSVESFTVLSPVKSGDLDVREEPITEVTE